MSAPPTERSKADLRAAALAKRDALSDNKRAAAAKAVANALIAAADRIERTTQVLNRTIGGGVAIG